MDVLTKLIFSLVDKYPILMLVVLPGAISVFFFWLLEKRHPYRHKKTIQQVSQEIANLEHKIDKHIQDLADQYKAINAKLQEQQKVMNKAKERSEGLMRDHQKELVVALNRTLYELQELKAVLAELKGCIHVAVSGSVRGVK
jgi:C4-dicarboxylate-specific signal transduction histidine kinase